MVTVATFAVGTALVYAVKATGTLRVSKQGELEGLDVHEHGGHAYPELTGGTTASRRQRPSHVRRSRRCRVAGS